MNLTLLVVSALDPYRLLNLLSRLPIVVTRIGPDFWLHYPLILSFYLPLQLAPAEFAYWWARRAALRPK
jgi:ABC-type dipeptide/oligopeptide/nickel transport system permease component